MTSWRVKNFILLIFSLIFYSWGEPIYILLMVFTAFFDWGFGLIITRQKEKSRLCRATLIFAIATNLGLLAYFKYSGLIFPTFSVALPIGISFYTFQALSYVIDVYRGEVEPQKSLPDFILYVSLFPQLIAGPIVRYRDIADQLRNRTHSLTLAASGIRTFCAGLAKKVLLGNAFGAFWVVIRDLAPDRRTALAAWLGLLGFTFQIYFDFSGYSDMAIGLGKIFGFRFPENFHYPYTAKNATDFWRRWHITLSSWFREYLYIPLGGNRCGRGRTILNMLIVWSLTGFWHGASLNFLLWGVYWFVLLTLGKLFFDRITEKLPSLIPRTLTFFAIMLGWLIFVFDGSEKSLTAGNGLIYLGNLFGSQGFANGTDVYDLVRFLPLTVIAAIASTPLPRRLFYKLYERRGAVGWAAGVACIVSLILSTAALLASSYNPFLYFRF